MKKLFQGVAAASGVFLNPLRGLKAELLFPMPRVTGLWKINCFRSAPLAVDGPQLRLGPLRWRDVIGPNLVVNEGLSYLLQCGLSNETAAITTWYILLMDASPSVAAGDTIASHAGWTENQNYDEATRQTWEAGSESGQSVDNSASKATFTMDTDSDSVGGAALASDNTKGGSTGTLYCGGPFTGGNKSVDDNDILEVQATLTQADDGI